MEKYNKYLEQQFKIHKINQKYGISDNEALLLDYLALLFYKDEPMKVGDVTSLKRFGSLATIHKQVTNLCQKDLLTKINSTKTSAKYLGLGKKGVARVTAIRKLLS